MRRSLVSLFVMPLVCAAAGAAQAVPRLLSSSFYQSPVRGNRGELLVLAGDDLQGTDLVIYQRLTNTEAPLSPPSPLPGPVPNAQQGRLTIVNSHDKPHALTVQLAWQMTPGAPYAIWVYRFFTGFSNPVRINNARPLWFTPAVVYRTRYLPNLGRELRVIGRNLESSVTPVGTTLVRITGPQTFTGASLSWPQSAQHHYEAKIDLPTPLLPGNYQVSVSRDSGVSWVAVPNQLLIVKDDPFPGPTYYVNQCGTPTNPADDVFPDDGLDDTACIKAALDIAGVAALPGNAGAAVVEFPTGQWDLGDADGSYTPTVPHITHGLEVPDRVSLRHLGSGVATIAHHAGWKYPDGSPEGHAPLGIFTLFRQHQVSDLHFLDTRVFAKCYGPYPGCVDAAAPLDAFLLLGRQPTGPNPMPPPVHDITIHGNHFIGGLQALFAAGGQPIQRLQVTQNLFAGTYYEGISLEVGVYWPNPFTVTDSIMRENRFEPGTYSLLIHNPDGSVAGHDGSKATEIGSGQRLYFTDNVADGTANQHVLPGVAGGWRAAFFFHLDSNHEGELVARNYASCTGDKAGDGEAIAYDGNHGYVGYYDSAALTAVSGTAVTTMTAPEQMKDADGNPIGYLPNMYAGHFLEIASGVGLGQARRIVTHTNPATLPVTFWVSPPFEITPQVGSSRVTVSRGYWQSYTVQNRIHNEAPCLNDNDGELPIASGVITPYGTTIDSTVEDNQQYATDGIMLYAASTHQPDTSLKYFVEVRGNLIDHERDYDDPAGSLSGITLMYSNSLASLSPVIGYGVNVIGNRVVHADEVVAGSIGIRPGFQTPIASGPVYKSALIQLNTIEDGVVGRVGIHVHPVPFVQGTTIYGNSFVGFAGTLYEYVTTWGTKLLP